MPRILRALVVFLMLVAPLGALTPTPRTSEFLDASESVFLVHEVSRVDVTIDPEDFQSLLDDPHQDDLKDTTVRWRNSHIDETHANVGMRVRGNSFREVPRKSWRLDFNAFVSGRDFHGLENVNLNGEPNDPTMVRGMTAWRVMRQMGVAAPRTNLVAMYVNGSFWSIQLNVEEVDEEFCENWFGEKDGHLYKCEYYIDPPSLEFVAGEDYASLGEGQTYQLDSGDPAGAHEDLAAFIRSLNQEPPGTLLTELEHGINIDDFMRYVATCVALGNWDGYWLTTNNYFIYNNSKTGRFEWIPWDMDQTLGVVYHTPEDFSTRHFETWGIGGLGPDHPPLMERMVFEHPEWHGQWMRYLAEAGSLVGSAETLAFVDEMNGLVTPYFDGTLEDGGEVGGSNYRADGTTQPVDYNPAVFEGHTLGVKPFCERRASSLAQQLAEFTPQPAPLPKLFINEVLASNTSINQDERGDFEDWIEIFNDSTSPINVGGMGVTDDLSSPTKWLIPNGTIIGAKNYLLLWADEEENEGPLHTNFKLANSGESIALFHKPFAGRVLIDTLEYPQLQSDVSFGRLPDGAELLELFVVVTPGAPNDGSGDPGEPRIPPRLFINEWMASNDSTIADDFGEFEDWVEIYNAEKTTVDLGGLHLTDNLANPTKWEFAPGIALPAGAFLIVWVDDDEEQGPLHTSFNLSANGEVIGIFDDDANANQLVDAVEFGPQQTDVSEGLRFDGIGPQIYFTTATPGGSNSPAASDDSGWMLR